MNRGKMARNGANEEGTLLHIFIPYNSFYTKLIFRRGGPSPGQRQPVGRRQPTRAGITPPRNLASCAPPRQLLPAAAERRPKVKARAASPILDGNLLACKLPIA